MLNTLVMSTMLILMFETCAENQHGVDSVGTNERERDAFFLRGGRGRSNGSYGIYSINIVNMTNVPSAFLRSQTSTLLQTSSTLPEFLTMSAH